MCRNGFSVALAMLTLGVAGCVTSSEIQPGKPIVQLECADIDKLVSTKGDEKYEIEFVNSRDDVVDMFWINYKGEEELKRTITPGGRWGVTTYITHPWVVRDKSGVCLALYDSRSSVLIEIQ